MRSEASQIYIAGKGLVMASCYCLWNPYYLSPLSLPATYFPAIECGLGGARFDLLPIRDEIAQLPNKRLEIKFIFSNGLVEKWRLGRGTVEALKELPTIRQAL